MNITVWDLIKDFYKTKFGIPRKIIDLISVIEILKLSVQGYSNEKIARYSEDGIQYIIDVLAEFLDFTGWDSDLDFSPIALYNKSKDFIRYQQEVKMISAITNESVINISYHICVTYFKYRKAIEKYYDTAD